MNDEPNEIIERTDMLIEETAHERTKPLDDGVDPIAREHRERPFGAEQRSTILVDNSEKHAVHRLLQSGVRHGRERATRARLVPLTSCDFRAERHMRRSARSEG